MLYGSRKGFHRNTSIDVLDVELFTIMEFLLRVDENTRSNPGLLVVQDMSRFNVVLYLFTHAFYNCLIG